MHWGKLCHENSDNKETYKACDGCVKQLRKTIYKGGISQCGHVIDRDKLYTI